MRRTNLLAFPAVAIIVSACSASPDESASRTSQSATVAGALPPVTTTLPCPNGSVPLYSFDASQFTVIANPNDAIYPLPSGDPSLTYAVVIRPPSAQSYLLYATTGATNAWAIQSASCSDGRVLIGGGHIETQVKGPPVPPQPTNGKNSDAPPELRCVPQADVDAATAYYQTTCAPPPAAATAPACGPKPASRCNHWCCSDDGRWYCGLCQ